MLALYRRHQRTYFQPDRFYKRCHCPMWVEGTVDAVHRRHSLKTNSWERAEQIRREIEQGKPTQPPLITFALDTFLEEQKARAVSEATQRKLRPLLAALRSFCASSGLSPDRIKDGRLFLYTQKTNVPVRIPLPDFVLHELAKLPLTAGCYFWKRESNSKVDTASGIARRALRGIFSAAGLPHAHPHQFPRYLRGTVARIGRTLTRCLDSAGTLQREGDRETLRSLSRRAAEPTRSTSAENLEDTAASSQIEPPDAFAVSSA